MKRTDLAKHQAKKLDGQLKSGIVPQRFGQGSNTAGPQPEAKERTATPKLVPLACRLPAALVSRLRERAVGIEGGMNAAIAQAAELWLGSTAKGAAGLEP